MCVGGGEWREVSHWCLTGQGTHWSRRVGAIEGGAGCWRAIGLFWPGATVEGGREVQMTGRDDGVKGGGWARVTETEKGRVRTQKKYF